MATRFEPGHVETWRREGCVLIENFFTPGEVADVQKDFAKVFVSASSETPLIRKKEGETGRFHAAQFKSFEAIPFECSPALNLIGVHPELVAFAKAALETEHLHLYQCQAWAKFTGDADYDQPFHCDFANHTLTVPSEHASKNSVTILCYFSDVSEAQGPMHYVRRSDSIGVAGPEATLSFDPASQAELQEKLKPYERSSAAPAGSIVPYAIDVFHRGTNMTAPNGYRYAVMACFKKAGDDAIGYHAWAFHHQKPWRQIFDHATPAQLALFGVPLPGDSFWTDETLRRAQMRYPDWDSHPYREALRAR